MITITPITPQELDQLLLISRRIFQNAFAHLNTEKNMTNYMDRAFAPEQLSKELEHPGSSFYFLRVNGGIAGYLKLNEAAAQSDLHDPESLEIERIYVDDAFQGQGLGARLIEFTKEQARARGLQRIWLGVWEKNPAAIRFYERHGFYLFGSHPFVFGDEVQTDLLMKHEL